MSEFDIFFWQLLKCPSMRLIHRPCCFNARTNRWAAGVLQGIPSPFIAGQIPPKNNWRGAGCSKVTSTQDKLPQAPSLHNYRPPSSSSRQLNHIAKALIRLPMAAASL